MEMEYSALMGTAARIQLCEHAIAKSCELPEPVLHPPPPPMKNYSGFVDW
jgi:hypothetical protein